MKLCRCVRPASSSIMLTRLCNYDPYTLLLYIVKLGFTGVCIIFALKHRLWVLIFEILHVYAVNIRLHSSQLTLDRHKVG